MVDAFRDGASYDVGTRFTKDDLTFYGNAAYSKVVEPFSAGGNPTGKTYQYDKVRTLMGAGPEGLACVEISKRMITRDSDMTRLLDRLEKQGLVRRERDVSDRRVVLAHLQEQGQQVLAELAAPVKKLHVAQAATMRELGGRLIT